MSKIRTGISKNKINQGRKKDPQFQIRYLSEIINSILIQNNF